MSNRDPYGILGVEKTASQDAIQRAYRSLAKKHHPDLNPDNAEAERKFKDAANAYAILGDAETRRRFDRGEIDAAGQERPEPAFTHGFNRTDDGFMAQEGFTSEEDLRDFLNEMFGAGGARQKPRPTKGRDVIMTIDVPFLEACRGGKRRLAVPGRRTLDIVLPAGLRDGELVRLRGMGDPGFEGGPPGDAFVEVHVEPHGFFRREGADIHLDLPVTFSEAVLGASVRTPTVHGLVDLKVPANAKAGQRLRLRGKGVDDRNGGMGDQFVRLTIVPPAHADAELKEALAAWAKRRKENPRAAMERAL